MGKEQLRYPQRSIPGCGVPNYIGQSEKGFIQGKAGSAQMPADVLYKGKQVTGLEMASTLISIIGSCFVLVGITTGGFFIFRIYQAIASNRWPFTIAELESTDLKQVIFRGTNVDGTSGQASALVVNFSYGYSVGNHKYYGSRVTFSDGINKTRGALNRLQKRYLGKSQVQVYYNPNNPPKSVLVPGLSIFNFTPLITSTLFVLAGLFIFTLEGKV